MIQTGFVLKNDGFYYAPPMDPNDVLDHVVDLTDLLGDDTLQQVDWLATNTTVMVLTNTNTERTATVWLRDGVRGKIATVQGTFMTVGGRTFERTFKVEITNR